MMPLLIIKSTNKMIGKNTRKAILRITFGLMYKAPIMSYWRNLNVALVIPQPGHGI